MSSDELAEFFGQGTVSVETYLGKSGTGVILYAAAADVPGFLSRKQRFVRDANGEQILSTSSFSADIAHADALAPKSRVSIPGQANKTTVISRDISKGGTVIAGIDRVKVYLQ